MTLTVEQLEGEIIKEIIHITKIMGEQGVNLKKLIREDFKVGEYFEYLGKLHKGEIEQPKPEKRQGWFRSKSK